MSISSNKVVSSDPIIINIGSTKVEIWQPIKLNYFPLLQYMKQASRRQGKTTTNRRDSDRPRPGNNARNYSPLFLHNKWIYPFFENSVDPDQMASPNAIWSGSDLSPINVQFTRTYLNQYYSGMRKFRIDQDFLIEHWHMIYIMPVVFAEIYFWLKLNSILDIN